jgi:hypothetical protein
VSAITVSDVTAEGPIGNLLHLVIFVAGAVVIGVIALAVIERMSDGTTPPRLGLRQIGIAVSVLIVVIGVEIAFHLLGRS